MFNNAVLRPLIGLPLAALIVFGLFSFMRSMIAQEFVPPELAPEREIVILTPPDLDPDEPRTGRQEVVKLDAAKKPPPRPKPSSTSTDINLPLPVLRGATPSLKDLGPVRSLMPTPVAISERDAEPIRKPLATYPPRMAERGIEGNCEVRLDVDRRGRPYNVAASCSHEGFEREAERAVQRSEFVPKIVRGQPVSRTGVIYPLEFRLDS